LPDAAWLVATMRYLSLDTPCLLFDDVHPERTAMTRVLVVRTPSSLPFLARYARRALAMRSRSARHHPRP
jgi:hypothetical protein